MMDMVIAGIILLVSVVMFFIWAFPDEVVKTDKQKLDELNAAMHKREMEEHK